MYILHVYTVYIQHTTEHKYVAGIGINYYKEYNHKIIITIIGI